MLITEIYNGLIKEIANVIIRKINNYQRYFPDVNNIWLAAEASDGVFDENTKNTGLQKLGINTFSDQ